MPLTKPSQSDNEQLSLRKAIRSGSPKKIIHMLEHGDVQQLMKQACTAKGTPAQLPLQILRERLDAMDIEYDEYEAIEKKLLEIMYTLTVKPLAETTNIEEAKSKIKHPISANEESLLHIACQLINHTRKAIPHSVTHPDSNKIELSKEIILKAYDSKCVAGVAVTLDITTLIQQRDIFLAAFENCGYGNCHEMAIYTLLNCSKKFPDISIEVTAIEYGDHVFTILSHNGAQVVCDPWSGEAYPFRDAELRARGHFLFNLKHLITFFNPKKQEIVTRMKYDADAQATIFNLKN